jgi:hypothetical protein
MPFADPNNKTLQPRTNTGKKTDKFKFKSALHILNAIGEIRSPRTTNDFALMFGLSVMVVENQSWMQFTQLAYARAVIFSKYI